MDKSSIYLSRAERERLARLSELEGLSQSAVIRRAILAYQPQVRGDREFALARSYDGPGDSVSALPEGELLEGFGDDADR